MASGVLAESSTTPSTSFIENLFVNLPTDARFKQVVTHKFVPRTGLDENSTQIEFVLPALDAPNCYFISNVMIEATVVITKADNTLPATSSMVVPVPNMLSSLFETVNLRINDNLITASGSNYSYKDFIQSLLSTPSDARLMLQSKGFMIDQPYENDTVIGNMGATLRSAFFRKGRTTTGAYKPEGATLIGKLNHDLSSSNNRILPPGTKIDFTLTRTRDQFYLMTKPAETGTKPSPADNEQYKAKITSCILYCPIGIMSERLTNEIYTKWESMPIKYFFNRLVVKSLTMPLNKAQFLSDNLFPESENPSRVFIVIVESDAYLGSYFKSPFTFRRNWLVEGLGSIQNSLQSENTYLKSSLDELKSQMSVLVNFIQNQQTPLNNQRSESNDDSENESLKAKRQKRSKRGKQKKKNNVEESQPSTSLLGRIYNSFQSNDNISLNEGGMSDIQSVSDFNPSAAEEQFGLQGIKTNYYITNIELELMSTPLDQFNSRGTEDDSMVDFVRLQKCINQFNQVLSCGISYDHFLKGAFIAAFDLTTNSQPNLTYAINTVRTGPMRLRYL